MAEGTPQPTSHYLIGFRDLCDERHKAVDERFRQTERAVSVALSNQEKRFDNTNEWRSTVDGIMDTLATKEALEALIERANKLENWRANIEGRMYMIVFGLTLVNIGIALWR